MDFKKLETKLFSTSIEIAKLSDGMYMLRYEHTFIGTSLECLLALCTVRTHKNCASTGQDLKGKKAYRPLTNSYGRGVRITADIVDNLFK